MPWWTTSHCGTGVVTPKMNNGCCTVQLVRHFIKVDNKNIMLAEYVFLAACNNQVQCVQNVA